MRRKRTDEKRTGRELRFSFKILCEPYFIDKIHIKSQSSHNISSQLLFSVASFRSVVSFFTSLHYVFNLVIIKPSSIMTKVKVVAPSDLGEGYQLTADVDGTSVVVVVPEGGVKEGEEFEGTSTS
jgi:hypothetical protein